MTNIAIVLCGLFQTLMVLGCGSATFQQQTNQPPEQIAGPKVVGEQVRLEWRPATYRGLTMGKSTSADMVRVLGKPKGSEPANPKSRKDKSNPEIWYEYESGEFPGRLIVGIDKKTKIIERLMLSPKHLLKAEAFQRFGQDYVITKYDFDDCLGDAESAPMYESPTGAAIFYEYRDRGIALAIEDDGTVIQVDYLSKPIGASKSKCKKPG